MSEEKTTEEKKFNPEDILSKGDGAELKKYVKSLNKEQLEACIKVVEEDMKKRGVSEEQIQSFRNAVNSKLSVKHFFAVSLPNFLIDWTLAFLILCKLIGVMPYVEWSWMMVLMPLWVRLAFWFLWPVEDTHER